MTDERHVLRDELRRAIDLARDEEFAHALAIFEQHLPRMTGGSIDDKRFAAAAMSYYGLCVAMVKRRYSEGVKYCKISIKSNMFDPEHHYNLARIYMERLDRRHAFEALSDGLRLSPHNKRLNRLLDEIGRRGRPPIPFLGRDNPLNVWLGKRRAAKKA